MINIAILFKRYAIKQFITKFFKYNDKIHHNFMIWLDIVFFAIILITNNYE